MAAPEEITAAFDRFVAVFRAGNGDPDPFLNQFEGEDRRELELLIEAFIETGPRRELEPDAPIDPKVAAVAAQVMDRIDGATGGLSRLVTALRRKVGLKQSDVVSSLASSLDATEAEREKIDAYYHDLEWGTLPAAGISSPLYDKLADILETKAQVLRDAAAGLGPGQASNVGPIFARTAEDTDFVIGSRPEPKPGSGRESGPRDRIDELFTGG